VAKKGTEEPKAENDGEELETGAFVDSIESALAETFSADAVRMFKRLAYEISVVGLSEAEACAVVGYDREALKRQRSKFPLLDRLFAMKALELKRDLLKTVTTKARKGDDKLAQWLLVVKFPQEFSPRRPISPGDDEDPLADALATVRETGAGVVGAAAGASFVKPDAGKPAAEPASKPIPVDDTDTLRRILAGK